MELTQARIKAATDGFRAVYLKAYEGMTPDWLPVAMEVESSTETETYEFLTGLPGMKELVGEVKLEDLASAGFSLRNKEWESTVPVKRAAIERDTLGIYRPMMSELGTNARNHPRTLVAALLASGFTALDYTGSAFFAANKKYNPLDSSKGALTVTNLGTAALAAPSFVTARTSLRKRTDARGNNLNLGRKLTLVVPPALEETANKLRTAELLPTAAGTASETNTLRNTFEVLVLNELTSDTAWFLVSSDREIKPLLIQYEVRPEFIAADDAKSTHVVLEKKFLYQAYGRWNAGYALPQLAYGSTGVA
jgi:phage major head subunit gpT-like protein